MRRARDCGPRRRRWNAAAPGAFGGARAVPGQPLLGSRRASGGWSCSPTGAPANRSPTSRATGLTLESTVLDCERGRVKLGLARTGSRVRSAPPTCTWTRFRNERLRDPGAGAGRRVARRDAPAASQRAASRGLARQRRGRADRARAARAEVAGIARRHSDRSWSCPRACSCSRARRSRRSRRCRQRTPRSRC